MNGMVSSLPVQGLAAPYITAWSGEEKLPASVIELPGVGIGYADESSVDRDRQGCSGRGGHSGQAQGGRCSARCTRCGSGGR